MSHASERARPIVMTEDLFARFDGKWDVSRQGCWIWNGSLDAYGYGIVLYKNFKYKAHRISYTVYKGAIPKKKLIRHTCDTPACVNPYHLITGTIQDNMKDRQARGRVAKGTDQWQSKINDSDAAAIYMDPRSQPDIARDYGIDPSNVHLIKKGKAWTHATKGLNNNYEYRTVTISESFLKAGRPSAKIKSKVLQYRLIGQPESEWQAVRT